MLHCPQLTEAENDPIYPLTPREKVQIDFDEAAWRADYWTKRRDAKQLELEKLDEDTGPSGEPQIVAT